MQVPDTLFYTSEHEWIEVRGTQIRVGVTDYAQDSLGEVQFVELPELGAQVDAGASIAEVESSKSVSEIYAPAAGTVSAINTDVTEQVELINSDPYGAGWLFELELGAAPTVNGWLSPADYQALVEG